MEGEKWVKRNVFFGSLCLHLHIDCREQGKGTAHMIHFEECTIDANCNQQLCASCMNLFFFILFFVVRCNYMPFTFTNTSQCSAQQSH